MDKWFWVSDKVSNKLLTEKLEAIKNAKGVLYSVIPIIDSLDSLIIWKQY